MKSLSTLLYHLSRGDSRNPPPNPQASIANDGITGTRPFSKPTNNNLSVSKACCSLSQSKPEQRLSRSIAGSFTDHHLGIRAVHFQDGPDIDLLKTAHEWYSNQDAISTAPTKSTKIPFNSSWSAGPRPEAPLLSNSNHDHVRSTETPSKTQRPKNHLKNKALIQPVVVDLEDDSPGKFAIGGHYSDHNGFQNHSDQHAEAQTHEPSARWLFSDRSRRAENTTVPTRSLGEFAPLVPLETFTHDNIKINPKANLELRDGDFIRVFCIIQNTKTSEVELKGWIFRRAKAMNGMLEPKMNELCWILHINEDDLQRHEKQGMESVPVTEVVKRRHICMTNRPFPELSFREHPKEPSETVYHERGLVCRFKYVCIYPNATARERLDWCEKALQRLRAEDCDKSHTAVDEELRHKWRGVTVKGGAGKGILSEEEQVLESRRQCHELIQSTKVPKRMIQKDYIPRVRSRCENHRGDKVAAPSMMDLNLLHFASKHKFSVREEIDGLLLGRTPPRKRQRAGEQVRHAKKNVVDLTHDESSKNSPQSSATGENQPVTARNVDSNPCSLVHDPAPEIVRIRALIDTTSESGTIRREYIGSISTSYLSASSRTLPLRLGDEEQALPTADPLKPSLEKKHDENTPVDPPFLVHPRKLLASFNEPTSLGTVLNQQQYSFGDCFCGAGGVSRGAVGAGLQVQWGFDYSMAACESYRLNFRSASVFNVSCDRFTSLVDIDHKVDICHLSPPCQYFSPAHTINGKDDDQNIASLFAVPELLAKAKPRIVTLEQTAGLVERHPIFFNAVIHMFTSCGFSIRWRILNCVDYGLAQNRKRLFMIASW